MSFIFSKRDNTKKDPNRFFPYKKRKYCFVQYNPRSFMKIAFRIVSGGPFQSFTLPSEIKCITFFDDVLLEENKTKISPFEQTIFYQDIKSFSSDTDLINSVINGLPLSKKPEKLIEDQASFFQNYFSFLRDFNFNDKHELLIHNLFLSNVFSILENSSFELVENTYENELEKAIIMALDDEQLRGIFIGYGDKVDKNRYETCKRTLVNNLVDHYPIIISDYF